MRLTRRSLLLAASAAPAALAAPYAADGPARPRAGALRGALLDVTLAGARLVAVGERGHVLLSDDQGSTWHQAAEVPTRTTLTCVHACDARQLWAAGHGGLILRSDDAGEHWATVAGQAGGTEVLLSIRVDSGGRGLAVGGFGTALETRDGGRQWAPVTLAEGEDGERHLNRIIAGPGATWLIAAEAGRLLLQPADGQPWQVVKTPYHGSLWGGAVVADTLVACGMRGNLVTSRDGGRTWSHQTVPEAGSFTTAVALPGGRAALAGVDGSLAWAEPGFAQIRFQRLDDRATLTGAVALPSGALVLATLTGMRVAEPPRR